MPNRNANQEFNLSEPQSQAPPPLPFLPVPGTFAHEWLREGSTAIAEGRLASDLRRAYSQFGKPASGSYGTPAGTAGAPPDKIFLEALSLSNELCFLTVLPNDPRIAVVHGLAVYAESFGAANPYQGRLLAFMGERAASAGGAADDSSPSSSLPPLLVAPMADAARVLFGSSRRRVARRETLAAFYDDAAAREHGPDSSPSDSWSLLHPAPSAEDDDDAEEAFLPKLAYIPRRWAPYFLGGPSPYEALRVAEQLVRTTLLGNEVGAAEPLLRWLRSACCRRSDAPHHAYRSAASVEWTPLLADHVSGAVRAWARERVGRMTTAFGSSSAVAPGGDASRIDWGFGVGGEGPVVALSRRPPPPIVVAEDVGGGESADSTVACCRIDQRSGHSDGNALVRRVSDAPARILRNDDSKGDPARQGQRNAMNASLGFEGTTRDVEVIVSHDCRGEVPPSNVEKPTRDDEVNISHKRDRRIPPSNVEGHPCGVEGNIDIEGGGELPSSNVKVRTRDVEGSVYHECGGQIPPSKVEVPTRDVEGSVYHEHRGQMPPSNVEGPTRDVEGNVCHNRGRDMPPSNVEAPTRDSEGNVDHERGREIPPPNLASATRDVDRVVGERTRDVPCSQEAVNEKLTPQNDDAAAESTGGSTSLVSPEKQPASPDTAYSLQKKMKFCFTRRNRFGGGVVSTITVPPSVESEAKRAFSSRNGAARIQVRDETNCKVSISGRGGTDIVVSGTPCDVELAEKIILELLQDWTQATSAKGLGQRWCTPNEARGRKDLYSLASKSTSASSTGQRKRRYADCEDSEPSRYPLGDEREYESGRISRNYERKRYAKSLLRKCFDLKDVFPSHGKIDRHSIGRLIGRRGSQLDELMKVTGSTILVNAREMTIDVSATNEEHFNNTVEYIKHFCRSLN